MAKQALEEAHSLIGNGDGYGYRYRDGDGNGDGDGYGYGDGNGTGDGDGDGYGDGDGTGTGYGYGDGTGTGYGDGYGTVELGRRRRLGMTDKDAFRNLKAALAEPEQEPVAWLWQHGETGRTRVTMSDERTATDVAAAWDVVGPHPSASR